MQLLLHSSRQRALGYVNLVLLRLQQPHIGAALVQFEPTAFDGEIKARFVLGGGGLEFEQHRIVDQLDIDPAGLHRFDAGGEFDQLARSGFRVSEGAFGRELRRYPMDGTTDLFQLKSGRTSARRPQAWQTKRGSISNSRTSSGQWSAFIATLWLHRKSAQ